VAKGAAMSKANETDDDAVSVAYRFEVAKGATMSKANVTDDDAMSDTADQSLVQQLLATNGKLLKQNQELLTQIENLRNVVTKDADVEGVTTISSNSEVADEGHASNVETFPKSKRTCFDCLTEVKEIMIRELTERGETVNRDSPTAAALWQTFDYIVDKKILAVAAVIHDGKLKHWQPFIGYHKTNSTVNVRIKRMTKTANLKNKMDEAQDGLKKYVTAVAKKRVKKEQWHTQNSIIWYWMGAWCMLPRKRVRLILARRRNTTTFHSSKTCSCST
jgi:hypothetical protein